MLFIVIMKYGPFIISSVQIFTMRRSKEQFGTSFCGSSHDKELYKIFVQPFTFISAALWATETLKQLESN